tara:strand:- start:45 stop:377 length:333 start_codon:yes stop_codon:yes gene_type:complete
LGVRAIRILHIGQRVAVVIESVITHFAQSRLHGVGIIITVVSPDTGCIVETITVRVLSFRTRHAVTSLADITLGAWVSVVARTPVGDGDRITAFARADLFGAWIAIIGAE